MARPIKDDVGRKRPMSFSLDEDNLLLWELLECTRSNFVATMLQYTVKDEKLRDIFYGSNGASALKAFELIEQRKNKKRQEILNKASRGTYKPDEPIKNNKASDNDVDDTENEQEIEQEQTGPSANVKKLKVLSKRGSKYD